MNKLILVSTLIAAIAQAQGTPPMPAGVTRGASVEGITEYQLPNGLHVLLFPDSSKTTATVNITYQVGSRHENYGETGMAHLLEHMMFKGSPRHRNVMLELTEHGARPNGTTWLDRTNYYETFQNTDVNMNWALDLESDRMVNSFIAKSDLDSEMTVVRNEFESGENSPVRILEERVLSTAYLWHNYGKSTIGARSDIENVPINRLQDFYHRYYQPDNAVLTIAGGIDEAKTLALVMKYFGSIPKPTRVLPKIYTEEPVQDGERSITLRRVGEEKVVEVGVHVPALAHPDRAAVAILANLLTDAPSGRLYKALVETKKAGSVFDDLTDTYDPGMLVLFALGPSSSDLEAMRQTFTGTLDDTSSTHPPTDEEVNRSKTKLGSQFELLLRNSERLGLLLSEYIGAGDWRLAFIDRDRIRETKTADVARAAKTYLTEANRTVGLFIPTAKPERAEIPKTPDIAALVKEYKGGTALEAGEVFDPSPANIDRRTIRGQLQPGIRLALVSKKTRGGAVSATLRLNFGDENSLRGLDVVGDLTGSMLMRGTRKHTRQQISDEFARLNAQVRVFGDSAGATVSVQATRASLPEVMALVTEILREPAFPENEFETLKQQELTSLEQQRKEPQTIAFLYAQRHARPFPKGDPRYVPTIEEQMDEIRSTSVEQIRNFYTKFYGASRAELAAVGDIDSEALEKQLGNLFAGWKSPSPYARVVTPFKAVEAVSQKFETPDKANALWIAVQPLKLDDANPDYPAILMANYMLGGGFLNSRLATRIRVKDGLSYGAGSQLQVPTGEDGALFLGYAIAAPQNVEHVEADFREEMEAVLRSGFTPKEIDAAKAGWLQSRQVSRGQDNELANRLRSQAYWGRTMAWDAKIEGAVKVLTPDQINTAVKKYLDLKQISFFKAGDFSKPAPSTPAAAPGGKSGGAR